jgi:hypothetical protein
MGVDVVLEDERGTRLDAVTDSGNLLRHLLPAFNSPDSQWLKYIDLYGDTIFNRLQIRGVLHELEELRRTAATKGERELLELIVKMARHCESEPHLYLRFVGD